MTPARRAELEALCRAATDAAQALNAAVLDGTPADVGWTLSLAKDKAYAALDAAARTALPEALAEVDRLTARWEALKAHVYERTREPGNKHVDEEYTQGIRDSHESLVNTMTRLERLP